MKKKLFIFAALLPVMLLSAVFSGCDQSVDTAEETALPAANEAETISGDDFDITGISSIELARLMGNGINLGNTMEAYGHNTPGIDAEISAYETVWGQPITTPEMIQAMKNAGFDSLRIPIAWTNTMDYENGDFTISPAYLERVGEIVNYALDADMFVVFNDHWDGGWWGMFGSADEATRQKAMDLYVSMWTQISEYFKDYSYKVIFESANEELGNRLNDLDVARDSGTLSQDECYVMNTVINQAFVDTVRASGGKNTDRFLLIAGYNTDIEMTCDERFNMPTDTADDKLLLSVHYYTPWSYCGTSGVASWGTESNYTVQNDLLEMMTKYSDQGYGIIFGEFAVLPKADGTLKNNTIDYLTNFLDNCDLYGYVPMLWSTNDFFLKEELKMCDDDLAALYLGRSPSAQSSMTEEEVKQAARESMDAHLAQAILNDANAPDIALTGSEDAIAWIMFNSLDYSITYSVGDLYDPTSKTEGVVATDAKIEEAGTYTVALDFTATAAGYADSTVFSAIGISNGELLFPGYLINITQVLINGEPYSLDGVPYTTADDGICTRVNLYNGWVSEIPPEARCKNPNMKPFLSATILDPQILGNIETISITFDYVPGE